MCSEVYHERLDTGSDTVIHSVQIETHLLQRRPVVSARKYRNGTTTTGEPTTNKQSLFMMKIVKLKGPILVLLSTAT